MRNTRTMIRSVSMPMKVAASISWAVARIAFPTLVFLTMTVKSAMSRNATTMTRILMKEMTTSPTWDDAQTLRDQGGHGKRARFCALEVEDQILEKDGNPRALRSRFIRGAFLSGR